MKRKYFFLVIAAVIFSGCAGYSPVIKEGGLSAEEEMLKTRLEEAFMDCYSGFTGSILIAKDNRIILNKGYGLTNIEKNIANQGKTAYHIVSLTKAFTAMAVLMLEEEGLLSVEDQAADYLPEFQTLRGITLHHLLTHTSGISGRKYNWETVSEAFANGKPEKAPGEEMQYSNGNYILLGKIIEKVSGEKYTDFMNKRILGPLGLEGSGWFYGDIPEEYKSLGYRFTDREKRTEIFPEPLEDLVLPPDDYPAGGLYSTTEDMFRWHRALNSRVLVKKETIDKMFAPYAPVDPVMWEVAAHTSEAHYGYGWCVYEDRSDNRFAMHEGAFPGYSIIITRGIDNGTFIMILSNLNYILDEIVAMNDAALEILSE